MQELHNPSPTLYRLEAVPNGVAGDTAGSQGARTSASASDVEAASSQPYAEIVQLPAQFLAEYEPVMQCESQGDPTKPGLLGERGLMQLHPVHIPKFEAHGWTWEDAYDPDKNLIIASEIWLRQGWATPWVYCAAKAGLR